MLFFESYSVLFSFPSGWSSTVMCLHRGKNRFVSCLVYSLRQKGSYRVTMKRLYVVQLHRPERSIIHQLVWHDNERSDTTLYGKIHVSFAFLFVKMETRLLANSFYIVDYTVEFIGEKQDVYCVPVIPTFVVFRMLLVLPPLCPPFAYPRCAFHDVVFLLGSVIPISPMFFSFCAAFVDAPKKTRSDVAS